MLADTLPGSVDDLAEGVTDGLASLITALGSVWGPIPRGALVSVSSGTASDLVDFIQSSLGYYAAGVAILAIIIGGARTAWERRAEPARATLGAMVRLVVVSSAGLLVTGLLLIAADSLASWILSTALPDGDLDDQLQALIAPEPDSSEGPLLIVILGVFAIFATAAQAMILVARGGALVVLAGVLPLSASFTSTEVGRNWFGRITAWILAFILYKPAAAIVLTVAFQLTGDNAIVGRSDTTGLVATLTGIVMLGLAIAMLPVLLRLLVPASLAIVRGDWRASASVVGQTVPSGAQPGSLVTRPPSLAAARAMPVGASTAPASRARAIRGASRGEQTSGD